MSTKIEGWVNEGYGHNSNITFITEKFPKVNRPMSSTLIIHDGPPEKVFTEAEVKAMLNELLDRSERDANMSTVVRAVEITHLAHKHNIAL